MKHVYTITKKINLENYIDFCLLSHKKAPLD